MSKKLFTIIISNLAIGLFFIVVNYWAVAKEQEESFIAFAILSTISYTLINFWLADWTPKKQ